MKTIANKIGIGMTALGVLMLAAGIIMGVTVGTYLVPILLTSSVAVNTVGVMLLRTKNK